MSSPKTAAAKPARKAAPRTARKSAPKVVAKAVPSSAPKRASKEASKPPARAPKEQAVRPPDAALSADAKRLAAAVERSVADGRPEALAPDALQALMGALCRA